MDNADSIQLKDLRARAKEAGVKGLSKRRLYTKHNKGELLEATLKAEEANETRRVAKLEENIANAEVVFYGSVADSYGGYTAEAVTDNRDPWGFLIVTATVTLIFAVGVGGWLSKRPKKEKTPNIKNELKPLQYSNGF